MARNRTRRTNRTALVLLHQLETAIDAIDAAELEIQSARSAALRRHRIAAGVSDSAPAEILPELHDAMRSAETDALEDLGAGRSAAHDALELANAGGLGYAISDADLERAAHLRAFREAEAASLPIAELEHRLAGVLIGGDPAELYAWLHLAGAIDQRLASIGGDEATRHRSAIRSTIAGMREALESDDVRELRETAAELFEADGMLRQRIRTARRERGEGHRYGQPVKGAVPWSDAEGDDDDGPAFDPLGYVQ